MAREASVRSFWVTAVSICAVASLSACGFGDRDAGLSKSEQEDAARVPVPAADGPKLGVISNLVPVRESPQRKSKVLGYLHAGARVARSVEPFSSQGCPGGWYPIRPRGFVCIDEGATIDLKHPTLQAMALAPALDQPLPYTYARTRNKTPLFERDPGKEDRVREVGELPRRSVLPVVGSWKAKDNGGTELRLGLLTSGAFVKAEDLEPASPSTFQGAELDGSDELRLAFVVKQGVRSWRIEDDVLDKLDKLEFHALLRLTGKFRNLDPNKYWAIEDGRYVRHQDVTVLRPRHVFPDFATGDRKWIDVSVITGTLVLYEGRRPVYATLVSVGRDRTGDPKTTASTALGTFEIVKKYVTTAGVDATRFDQDVHVHDAPWALELSSGQFLHGALWHDRFGIEHGPGNVQLSIADAAHVWRWAEPDLPEGWHVASDTEKNPQKTLVVVRK